MNLRRLLALVAVGLALAGCANLAHVPPGETIVASRVVVQVDGAWNQLPNMNAPAHRTAWTLDGQALDLLEFRVGVKDGELLAAAPPNAKDARPLVFRATMQPHEIVGLFEGLFARGGSTFTLERLEPAPFLGGQGFRFQFSVLRKGDEVRLAGTGWALVQDGQLHAMTFVAPRLGFYPRHIPRVEAMARSARLRS